MVALPLLFLFLDFVKGEMEMCGGRSDLWREREICGGRVVEMDGGDSLRPRQLFASSDTKVKRRVEQWNVEQRLVLYWLRDRSQWARQQ